MAGNQFGSVQLETAILVALRDSHLNGFAVSGALTGDDLAAAVGTTMAVLRGLLQRMRRRGAIDYYVADGEVSVVWTTTVAWRVVEPLTA
jgi:hypothetical protein